jgi:endonuclease/exonuclease/phosphatase family metal-dependent hydrolase
MTYNLENYCEDGSSESSRNDDFRLIIDEIKPDIIIAQEIWGVYGGDNIFLDNVLNHENRVFAKSFIDQKADGGSSNDIWQDIGVFYKAQEFKPLSVKEIDIADGYVRDALEVKLEYQPVQDTITVYGVHFKAGNSNENADRRSSEAIKLRSYCNRLPDNTPFLIAGDYNLYSSSEGGWQKLTESQNDNSGRVYDPIDKAGDWHENPSYSAIHTQSTRYNQGGLDDRFDFILISNSIRLKNSFNYIEGSYKSYGNDGQHLNSSVNYGGNRVVRDEVADALYNASDHLPVYADFKIGVQNRTDPAKEKINSFRLFQNYPNPFNSTTIIKYSVPYEMNIWINIYSISGRLIRKFKKHPDNAGEFQVVWNGKNEQNQEVSAGIYYYQIQSDSRSLETRKMLFLK